MIKHFLVTTAIVAAAVLLAQYAYWDWTGIGTTTTNATAHGRGK